MSRLFLASAWLIGAFLQAQAVRPDFSGEWALDLSRSTSTGAPSRVSGPARGPAAPGVIREPVKIKDVRPRYPPDAQRARISGMVLLEAVIDRRGKVDDIRVLRSVPELDRAAVEAVSQWEYSPTLLDGVAIPVIMTITVTFSLDSARPQMGTPVAAWPSQPAGAVRPGFGRGVTAPTIVIEQDDKSLTIKRNFGEGSDEIKYRFDGRESRNKLPGTGGAVDNVYTFTSGWDGAKLVSHIRWQGPQGARERTETISIDNDVLTIQTIRPAAPGGGEPFVQTNVFLRKK